MLEGGLVYSAVKGLSWTLVSSFYGEVNVIGRERIPRTGPVIFISSHPNALVDPLLVINECGRIVSALAKDQLFTIPVLGSRTLTSGPLMRAAKCVPVKRSGEHQSGQAGFVDNSELFSAVFAALAQGNCITVFPEGTTHVDTQLKPLKTGTARMALEFSQRYPDAQLQIVPVGLNYMNREKWRSKVLVAFGPSITVPLDLVHRYNPATPEGFQPARDLTAIFEQALKSLTINTPDWATLKVLHTAREVYVPENVELTPAQYLEITNHMVADYKIMAQKNPAAVEPVRKMLEEYQLKLDILRLTDREVAGKFERVNLSPAMLVLTFVLWPLALIGTALNLPIAIGAAIGGARLARGEWVEWATYKLLTAIILAALVYTGVPVLLCWLYGWKTALLVALFLPFSGFAALNINPLAKSIDLFRNSFKIVPKELRAERAQVKQALLAAVDHALSEVEGTDKNRLFYKKIPA